MKPRTRQNGSARSSTTPLTTKTITERRSAIKNSDYWKQEAIHYKSVFANVVFDILRKQCTTESTDSADSAESVDWQKMTHLYKRRFARQGLDAEEFEKTPPPL